MKRAKEILKSINNDPMRFRQLKWEEQGELVIDVVNSINKIMDLFALDPEAQPEANMEFFIKQSMKLAYEDEGRLLKLREDERIWDNERWEEDE